MRYEPLDPMKMDDSVAATLSDVATRTDAIDDPDPLPRSAESFRLARQYGHDNRPTDFMWLAVDNDDVVRGCAEMELSIWDNPQLAFTNVSADPELWGTGVRTALLDLTIAAAREHGRTQLLAWTTGGGEQEAFHVRHGFEPGLRMARRTLLPTKLDLAEVQRLHDDAADRASEYELVRLDGRAPDELIPSLISLFEAINDAPLDDLDVEPDEFPVERVRAYDDAMEARRQHVYRIMARHRPSGDFAGHTILCVDETRPGVAFQEDTSVVGAHRGHRLGMLLKSAMVLWMRDERPELERIDTTNAYTNTHMIAVNDELGCTVTGAGVALQLSL